MKITQEQFESLYSSEILKKDFDAIISLIDQRFTEICQKFLIKKNKNYWFDYDNASYDDDGVQGVFDPDNYKTDIGITGEWIDPPEGYDFSFPTRWLWEDFEEELKTETEKAIGQIEKAKEKAKEKRLQKKANIKALQESIRQKLTKEELKAIKFVKV